MFSSRPCLRRFVERNEENLPVLREEENMITSFSNVEFSFSADTSKGVGKLYVTTERIIWLSTADSFDFDVRYIMLHAVSKDVSTYPKPCIYCQLDVEYNEEEEGEEEESEPSECFFVPEEPEDLMTIFDTFSQAAQLNPDPEEEEEDELGEGMIQYGTDDFIYNEEEVMNGAQQAKLMDWESKFNCPANNQFDDAPVEDTGNLEHVAKVTKLEE